MRFFQFMFRRFLPSAFICLKLLFLPLVSNSQDKMDGQKRIYFPHPMSRPWQMSVGFVTTTLIHEITEEVRFRVPAADIHVLKRLGKNWRLDARLNLQIFQNLASIGPKWSAGLSDRLSFAIGNDLSFWMGAINRQGFKTRGSGWQSQPNISFGYRFDNKILLTGKAEMLMSFGKKTFAGETPVGRDYDLLNGSAFSVFLEQPFFAEKSITLGFRALFTNFLWQTWALFANYDRNLFYPQLIVGIIL